MTPVSHAPRSPSPLQVSQLVGMAPLKAFLAELNAKVTYVERGGDPRLLEGCLNVVLTGESWDASRTGLLACVYRSLTRAAPQQLTPLFRPLCRQPRRGEDDGGPPPLPRPPRVRYALGRVADGEQHTRLAHLTAPHRSDHPVPPPPSAGLLRKDVFVERNALELKGTREPFPTAAFLLTFLSPSPTAGTPSS